MMKIRKQFAISLGRQTKERHCWTNLLAEIDVVDCFHTKA